MTLSPEIRVLTLKNDSNSDSIVDYFYLTFWLFKWKKKYSKDALGLREIKMLKQNRNIEVNWFSL